MCKTYYVDPQTGRDTNDGLTPEKPLATLFAVNRLALAPGDTVLLKCGSVFEKQFLHLRCCGKKDSPITIAAYGEGPAPRIDADGQGLWYQDYGCALDAPPMYTAGMYPPPCCCMMQPMSRCVIWN